ncbi:MAG: tetratricopeptide repeat protein [Bacteroidia bacterium]
MSKQETEHLQETIQTIARFFENPGQGAFLFAVLDDEKLLSDINRNLQTLLLSRKKTIRTYSWKEDLSPEQHPLTALQDFLKKNPGTDGILLVDINLALSETARPQLLTQLNFAREELRNLKIPLLFWVSSRIFPTVLREAMDLYDQRATATFFFDQSSPEQSESTDRYVLEETLRTSKRLQEHKYRIKLLHEQLESAEKKHISSKVIANDIVIPLLEVYVILPDSEEAIKQLLKKYKDYADVKNPNALTVLAGSYGRLNLLPESANYYKKALDLYRKLAAENPEIWLKYIGMILHNLGNIYKDLNEFETALSYYNESIWIYEQIGSDETYGSLAHAKNNLARLFASKNEFSKAQLLYEEVLSIFRSLEKEYPDEFLGEIAMVMNNLAVLHKARNEFQKARIYYEQSLAIRRKQVEQNPQMWLDEVAMSLNNLGNLYRTLNNLNDAIPIFEEVISIYRRFVQVNPQIYSASLAAALYNFGIVYKLKNDFEKAKLLYSEALDLLRNLVKENPSAYLPQLSDVLNNLGILYHDTKELGSAQTFHQEALEIRKNLSIDHPSAFLPKLALSMNNLALVKVSLNNLHEALILFEDAFNIYKDLSISDSQAYLPELARTAINLSRFYLTNVPDQTKSLQMAMEAIQATKSLKEMFPMAENQYQTARQIIQAWGLDPDKYINDSSTTDSSHEK